jgi:Holliday junction resolvase RusA-like endonuclease
VSEISFIIYGSAIAQPRQRHRIIETGFKKFVHNYTPAKAPVNAWKSDVKAAAVAEIKRYPDFQIWRGPIELTATFYLPRPQSKFKKKDSDGPIPHVTKPDIENLLKAGMDALTGVVFVDDKLICEIHCQKLYHEKNKGPRAEIALREIE